MYKFHQVLEVGIAISCNLHRSRLREALVSPASRYANQLPERKFIFKATQLLSENMELNKEGFIISKSERGCSFHFLLFKWLPAALAGPGWGKEPGTPSESPMCVAGALMLEAYSITLPSKLTGSWIWSGTSMTETSSQIWDASIVSRDLSFCTTMLPHPNHPELFLLHHDSYLWKKILI